MNDIVDTNWPSMGIIKVQVDAAAHSEHGVLIRCNIRAKPIECSELACQIW
jgi:hypothetical protein